MDKPQEAVAAKDTHPAEQPPRRNLADRADAGEKLTPEELAEITGNTFVLRPNVAFGSGAVATRGISYSVAHAAAAQCHGWAAHAQHSAEPFRLTRADYLKALEAAAKGEPPHEPAMSKYTPAPFRARLTKGS